MSVSLSTLSHTRRYTTTVKKKIELFEKKKCLSEKKKEKGKGTLVYIYFKKKQEHQKRKNVFWIELKTNSVRKIDVGFCLFFFKAPNDVFPTVFSPGVVYQPVCTCAFFLISLGALSHSFFFSTHKRKE